MARMPGVKYVPLGRQTQPRMRSHDIVCIHTMVGSLDGTESMFKQGGYTGTESHFGTSGSGETRQWQDTDYTADANYRGSSTVISIENADHGPEFPRWNTAGDNVPPFTPAQIEANAQIIAWAHKEHGIPIALIPDTKPGRRGVGYHAQGVPGNGLVPGGVSWSKARGKVCPGRKRIAQIPQIIRRAQEIAGGTNTAAPAPEGILGMTVQKPKTRQKDLKLPQRKWKTIPADDEGNTSILFDLEPGDGAMVNAHIALKGLPPGANAQVRFYTVSYKAGTKTRRLWTHYMDEIVGTAGITYANLSFLRRNTSKAAKGRSIRIRAEIRVFDAGVTLTRAQFNRAKG